MLNDCSSYSETISNALFEELKTYVAPVSRKIFKMKIEDELKRLLSAINKEKEKMEIAEAIASGKYHSSDHSPLVFNSKSPLDEPLLAERSEDDCDDCEHDPLLTKEELDRDLDDFLELRAREMKSAPEKEVGNTSKSVSHKRNTRVLTSVPKKKCPAPVNVFHYGLCYTLSSNRTLPLYRHKSPTQRNYASRRKGRSISPVERSISPTPSKNISRRNTSPVERNTPVDDNKTCAICNEDNISCAGHRQYTNPPVTERNVSSVKGNTPSPVRVHTPSPVRVHTPSPVRVHTPSPVRVHTPSPVRGHLSPTNREVYPSTNNLPDALEFGQGRLYSESESSTLGASLEDIVNKALA
jgi:hypothetical protein